MIKGMVMEESGSSVSQGAAWGQFPSKAKKGERVILKK